MRNGKAFWKLLIPVLLAALISSFSCRSAPSTEIDTEEILAVMKPPVPAAPVMEAVRFEDRDNGLWLSYNDYRALERNVIAMREYAAALKIIVKFYEGE